MRREWFLILVPMILLLTACGKESPKDKLEGVTRLYAGAPNFTARVRAEAELDGERQEYVLEWQYAGGVSYMTVTEPECVAGISAETGDEGLTFRYDDLILVIEPSGAWLSPIEALPELLYDWSGGLCLDRCAELLDGEPSLAVTYSHERRGLELEQRVWFDMESLYPLKAELYSEGARVMTCEFLLFELQ